MLVEGILDCLCYLLLFGPGDLVFLVFRSRSYPVRDFLAVSVWARLESGYLRGEAIGGE